MAKCSLPMAYKLFGEIYAKSETGRLTWREVVSRVQSLLRGGAATRSELRSFDRAAIRRASGRTVARSDQNQDSAQGLRSPDAGGPGDSIDFWTKYLSPLENR